jgi:hypothetical protein
MVGSTLGVYTFGLILVSAEKHLSLSSDIPPVSICVPPARAGYPHRGQQCPRRPRHCFGRRVPNFQRPPRHLCTVSKVLLPRLPRTRAAYGGDCAAFCAVAGHSVCLPTRSVRKLSWLTQPCTFSCTGQQCSRRASAPTLVSALYCVPVLPNTKRRKRSETPCKLTWRGERNVERDPLFSQPLTNDKTTF